MEYGSAPGTEARGSDALAPPHSDIRLSLPARPDHVVVVRHLVGALAESLRLPRPLVEDIRLAITEAFTNVVRHAYIEGEDGPVDIDIETDVDRLMITVSDNGCGMRRNPSSSGPGLGLPLISALTDGFEIIQPTGGGSALHMSFPMRTGRFHRSG
jgi:serine/threonine-protein kinase RsbW